MISMRLNDFYSFVKGLIFTGVIYIALLFFFAMETFSFSGQTLDHKENTDAFWFYSVLVITGITAMGINRCIKMKRHYAAAGICLPFLFALYAFFCTGIEYYTNQNYLQVFDKTIWGRGDAKPFNMAKTLVKKKILIGRSRQDIIRNLGMGEDNGEASNNIRYFTDRSAWELRIRFTKNKVTDAYIYQEGLSL